MEELELASVRQDKPKTNAGSCKTKAEALFISLRFSCLLLTACCFLLFPAARLRTGRGFRLRRVVNFARFDHVSFVVVLSVAVHVHLYHDLVSLAVRDIIRLETEAVLAAQHRVD